MGCESYLRQPPGSDRSQRVGRKRSGVCSMICVEPGTFDTRRIREPGHGLRIFVALDERGQIAAVFEQQWRSRRALPDMEARHGTEELYAGDALHRRIDRGKSVD